MIRSLYCIFWTLRVDVEGQLKRTFSMPLNIKFQKHWEMFYSYNFWPVVRKTSFLVFRYICTRIIHVCVFHRLYLLMVKLLVPVTLFSSSYILILGISIIIFIKWIIWDHQNVYMSEGKIFCIFTCMWFCDLHLDYFVHQILSFSLFRFVSQSTNTCVNINLLNETFQQPCKIIFCV